MSQLSRYDKILLAMFELSNGSTKPLAYEDIVVKTFELFPGDFALQGYPQYPNSSDVHKPLYGPLKDKGLVRTANKNFSLTEKGIEHTRLLSTKQKGEKAHFTERLSRDKQKEVDRLLQTDAFKLFEMGEKDKLLDSDLYAFYGVTVRTKTHDFLGRITAAQEAINEACRVFPEETRFTVLSELNSFLLTSERFTSFVPKRR